MQPRALKVKKLCAAKVGAAKEYPPIRARKLYLGASLDNVHRAGILFRDGKRFVSMKKFQESLELWESR
jgi:hypothetical protein